ncbi:Alcohol dehydrogenase [Chondromyces apiculatus DSM 436]|uniref:Alcohol dehydrogenase n=2 Tax=Chondromyces apiculatus TaxID=51 RepID=A0A017THJ4_9BACT|nr:Alcohol dehydrogenase [Chondromyces apiculatus DSM 436]
MQLRKPGGLDNLLLTEVGVDGPGRGQILVRLHASSLNYHDYAVVAGMIPTDEGRIPMSDGAGVVAEVGEGVTELAVGDHVVSTFFPNWPSGDPSPEKLTSVPGDSTDGYARERVVAPTRYFTKVPRDYTHAQAATLPCAALTAWRALVVEGRIKPGETVLVQGTGGVSIFALQFAKAAGCKVIATSSSAAKLERLKSLGADQVINYKDVPAWGDAARHLAGGQGVDHIVEIGGAGTLSQSIAAARIGGHISLIGVLAGYQGDVSTATLMMKQIRLIGIGVGTREQQQDMIRAIDAAGIKPVIDRSFPLEELAAAFRYQESGAHFGKICVEF